jgi:hypothetical protein
MEKNSIWLITLEITSESEKLMRFLDSSKSNEYVADFLENLLPIVANDTWEEKLIFKRATAKWSDNEPHLITCCDSGYGNPLLVARKVENLGVKKDENGQESIEFKLVNQKTLRYIKAKNGDMRSKS